MVNDLIKEGGRVGDGESGRYRLKEPRLGIMDHGNKHSQYFIVDFVYWCAEIAF
jgi:hypothetical protein